LSTQEAIGDPALVSDYLFSYLIPVGERNLFQKPKREGHLSISIGDAFLLSKSDTVFTMRKGIITCTPDISHSVDRIKAPGSLEILHQEGTIMVYHNLDPLHLFYTTGDIALPGSPLGLVNSQKFMGVELYELKVSEMLQKIPIHYWMDGQNKLYLDLEEGDRIEYPESILQMELSDKERRKLDSINSRK
jgi:hypothetical protein